MKFTRLLLPAGLLVITLACNKTGNSPGGPCDAKKISLNADEQAVVAAHNRFAFDFLREAVKNYKVDNELVSPLSIYLALGMVYNGTDGPTKDFMQQALRMHNIDIEVFNKTCRRLIEELPEADCKVTMNIANAIWHNASLPPLQGFANTVSENFHATLSPFPEPNPVAAINKWVSDNTRQKIKKIVDDLSPDEVMLLVNAIYFKGSWLYKFDKKKTTSAAFTKADGSTIQTPFMKMQHDSILYYGNDTLQMVELPYGSGNFSMYVLLPHNKRPEYLAEIMTADVFARWQANMQARKVSVSLPRFKYSYSIDDMRPVLSTLGTPLAGNFSKMYSQPAEISRAVHKTFIEVNEEGTEAAAVTAIGIILVSLPAITEMNVNRPFLYVIAEKTSSTILFTGLVHDPSATQE